MLEDGTGTGEFVAFRIDFAGLHSFEGGKDLTSGFNFVFEFVNIGGLMYFVHGEKFTRLDCRLEGTPVEILVWREESRGVCTAAGESSVRSLSSKSRDVLGGVGGRAGKGPRTSTIFPKIK